MGERPTSDRRAGYDVAKRTFDVTAAVGGLIVLSPVMLTIAAVIRASSPGPIMYRGARVGFGGESFRIFKFRTMAVDAERSGTTTALGDARITPVGRFLRRYKLDELPQLLNVLSGDMSIVGPRPEVEEHTSVYTPEEQAILSVLPGITDYASIELVNLDEVLGSEDPHQVYLTRVRAQKNALRLKYVKNRSFGEDLKIIARTMLAIAGKSRRKPVTSAL
jgi:lipopolysaccharide/colanic/teichoic acid biosynthesis glycosyltransferase